MWKLHHLRKPYKIGKAWKLRNREDLLFVPVLLLTCFYILPLSIGTQIPAVLQTRGLRFFLDFSPKFLTQQSVEGCSQSSPDYWECSSIPKDLKRLPEMNKLQALGNSLENPNCSTTL